VAVVWAESCNDLNGTTRRRARDDAPPSVIADYLSAFADPTRLRMVDALASGEVSASALAGVVGQNRPIVSYHLGLLARRVVKVRTGGRFRLYSLLDASVAGRTITLTAHGVTLATTFTSASAAGTAKKPKGKQ
jgi:ArsR family transcriptional regulator